jgi:hypothetical protein
MSVVETVENIFLQPESILFLDILPGFYSLEFKANGNPS